MADTGWKSPSATGGSFNNWDTTPENAYASDDARASTRSGIVTVDTQSYEDFNFGIAADAIIDGVEIRVEHFETDNPTAQLVVQWYSTSDVSISSVYQPPHRSSDTVDDGGGPVDLWGRTPIDTDFSNDNFYVKVSCPISNPDSPFCFIDHIQVKVHYTLTGTTTSTSSTTTSTSSTTTSTSSTTTSSSTSSSTSSTTTSSSTSTSTTVTTTSTSSSTSSTTTTDAQIPVTHLKIDKSEEEMDIIKENLVVDAKALLPSGTTTVDFTEWADADVTWADADSEWVGGLTYDSNEEKPTFDLKGKRYGSS